MTWFTFCTAIVVQISFFHFVYKMHARYYIFLLYLITHVVSNQQRATYHYHICNGLPPVGHNVTAIASPSLHEAYNVLQMKALRVAEEMNNLYLTYNEERIETPLNETRTPTCLRRISFENAQISLNSPHELEQQLSSDFTEMSKISIILNEIRQEETRYDEGIYSLQITVITNYVEDLLCQMYNTLGILNHEEQLQPKIVTVPFVKICRSLCRTSRYMRDVYLLFQMKTLAMFYRNKYHRIRRSLTPL